MKIKKHSDQSSNIKKVILELDNLVLRKYENLLENIKQRNQMKEFQFSLKSNLVLLKKLKNLKLNINLEELAFCYKELQKPNLLKIFEEYKEFINKNYLKEVENSEEIILKEIEKKNSGFIKR